MKNLRKAEAKSKRDFNPSTVMCSLKINLCQDYSEGQEHGEYSGLSLSRALGTPTLHPFVSLPLFLCTTAVFCRVCFDRLYKTCICGILHTEKEVDEMCLFKAKNILYSPQISVGIMTRNQRTFIALFLLLLPLLPLKNTKEFCCSTWISPGTCKCSLIFSVIT